MKSLAPAEEDDEDAEMVRWAGWTSDFQVCARVLAADAVLGLLSLVGAQHSKRSCTVYKSFKVALPVSSWVTQKRLPPHVHICCLACLISGCVRVWLQEDAATTIAALDGGLELDEATAEQLAAGKKDKKRGRKGKNLGKARNAGVMAWVGVRDRDRCGWHGESEACHRCKLCCRRRRRGRQQSQPYLTTVCAILLP